MTASLKEGSARSPMSSAFDSWASSAATPAKIAAIKRDAMPSHRLSPVRIAAVVPAAATKIPTTAAESSKTTMNAGGSFDWRKASHQPRLRFDCLNARAPIDPGGALEYQGRAEHQVDHQRLFDGLRLQETLDTLVGRNTGPTEKISNATTKLQKYSSRA